MERAEAERFEFVFGGVVSPGEWADADEDERIGLVEKRFGGLDQGQVAVRALVVSQLLAGEPPEVWSTARRLAASGLGADRVINQLAIVVGQSVRDTVDRVRAAAGEQPLGPGEREDDGERTRALLEERLTALLDRLPLPSPDAVEGALAEVAGEAGVIGLVDLVAKTVARFGGWADEPLFKHVVESSLDHVLDDETGPLVSLADDLVVDAGRLREGIVLTHVLTDAELAVGALHVSFDLAGFGRILDPTLVGEPLDCLAVEAGHLAWSGPEGWLDRFDAGDVLAVRAGGDGSVQVDRLPESPPVDPELVGAVRRVYDREVEEPGLPVSGEELVFGVLAADRDAFRVPQAPLEALCEAAGLERRGSEVAHDPAVWASARRLGHIGRVLAATGGDDELADGVLAVLDVAEALAAGTDGSGDGPPDVGEALESLGDPEVLALVSDELFDPERWSEQAEVAGALVDAGLGAARRGPERATARYLAARAAEASGDASAAEQHLHLAVEADAGHVGAIDRLAWYASDRGDAARAVRLWRRCPPMPTVVEDLAVVEPFARAPKAGLGRNERCWCGSGRKYKHCHLGVTEPPPLPARVGWLCRKATDYLVRSGPAAQGTVVEIIAARAPDPDDEDQIRRVMDDPLVIDLALTEGGWFDRFLAERGALLPDDEALLAASWAVVDRTVYEVAEVRPRRGLVVRDLRTGGTLDVRERTFSTQAHTGMLVCARAVPDGEGHQFVGAVFPVVPGTEARLLDLLDEGDPGRIAAWVGARERPPQLRTREREPLVDCEIVVTTDDVPALVAHLDDTYDRAGRDAPDGADASDSEAVAWIEHHDLDEDEAVVRASLRLDGDRLIITTNSHQRADRILARLRGALDRVAVIDDTRTPVDPTNLAASRRGGLPDLSSLPQPPGVPDERTIAEIQDHLERRWCDEPVPALGGVTPRQAADDPTRREQLERLLASFDASPTPAGAFGMRTDKLRTLLGL